MKKKIIFLVFIVMIFSLTMIVLTDNDEKIIYSSESHKLSTEDTLAMMYETEADSGEYTVSDDTGWPAEGYVFNAELSRCENGSTLYWDEETKSVMMEANVSDKCYVYFDIYIPTLTDVCTVGANLANCIVEFNTLAGDGADGLYYHDGQGSYTNANQEAEDNSYRFSGADPNNYVCFGSDEDTCPDNNLYRIIGVFNNTEEYQVKLIKVTSFGQYIWNEFEIGPSATPKNTWSSSDLNLNVLNNTFYNEFDNVWKNKIAKHTFIVGGNVLGSIDEVPVKTAYQNEIINPAEITTNQDEIGLMYVSDYGYAASPENWNTILGANGYNQENVTSANWMFTGINEWTITRWSNNSYFAYCISNDGGVGGNDVTYVYYDIRPSFYLLSNVEISKGTGTVTDPYHIV